MSARTRLPLALTLGEPAGIGPDLTLAIWLRRVELDLPAFYLIGDVDFLKRRAGTLGLDVPLSVVTPADTAADIAAAFERALRDVAVREPLQRSSADLAPQLRDLLDGMEVGHLTPPEATPVLRASTLRRVPSGCSG